MVETSSFQTQLEALFAGLSHKTDWQEKAWQVFQKTGMPTQKWEDYKRFPLEKLYEENLCLPKEKGEVDLLEKILPGFSQKHLLLVEGKLQGGCLSELPQEVVALPLEEAQAQYAFFLQTEWKKKKVRQKDPFFFLNEAFSSQGAFLYFPENLGKVSLQVIHILTKPCFSFPKMQVMVGKNTELTLYESFYSEKEAAPFFCNASLDLQVQKKAKIDHKRIFPSSKGKILTHIHAQVEEEAEFTSFTLSCSSSVQKNNYSMFLTGEKAKVILEGLSAVSQGDFSEVQVEMHHESPHTYSHQNFKTVLQTQATFSFNGLIQIEKEAQKTEAYQLVKSLLTGEKAISYAKPRLKIFADDVKASHGATLGKLSKEELFYLQTRGIPEKKARDLLTLAFMGELKDRAGLFGENFLQVLQNWA